jgi:ribosome-associated toxin RatA of RatAB toxin-antitoxin module
MLLHNLFDRKHSNRVLRLLVAAMLLFVVSLHAIDQYAVGQMAIVQPGSEHNGEAQIQQHDDTDDAVTDADSAQILAVTEPPLNAEKLESGEVLMRFTTISNELQRVRAWVLIAAPRQTVWDILLDCDQARNYVPDMRECVIRHSGKTAAGNDFDITYHRVKPFFFMASVENVFQAEYLPPDSIRFHRVAGDLVHFTGLWQFTELSANSMLLHYEAELDLRAAVDVGGERPLIRNDVRSMLKRLKLLSEQAFELAGVD